jgi:uncharacterized protein
MNDEIGSALSSIETACNVRILLAVESGSRAWGFASPDSDFDVRFIYVHEPAWYMSVFEQRDVIEQMLPGDLDVSGWELRKSLRLLTKCNLALNEWIGSPLVYREAPGFRDEFQRVIPAFFNPIAATHHYNSMARQALSELEPNGQITIKKYLYATRAMLACRWIVKHASQPPTEFRHLVDDGCDADERMGLEAILAKKSVTNENGQLMIESWRRDAMFLELENHSSAATSAGKPGRSATLTLDAILLRWTGMWS